MTLVHMTRTQKTTSFCTGETNTAAALDNRRRLHGLIFTKVPSVALLKGQHVEKHLVRSESD